MQCEDVGSINLVVSVGYLIWLGRSNRGVMDCNEITCRLAAFENGESLSDVSDPQEELSLSCSEFPNFLAALGDGGGGLLLQTWDCMCSHILRNLRMFPDSRMKVTAYRNSLSCEEGWPGGFGTGDISTWNLTWRCIWNIAGPEDTRLYSTLKDIGLATLWLSSAICNTQRQNNLYKLVWNWWTPLYVPPWPLTDKKAWIRSAFTVANGFPRTKIVYASSRSDPIKLPNQERFVSSGEPSGVRWTSSLEAESKLININNSVIKRTVYALNGFCVL